MTLEELIVRLRIEGDNRNSAKQASEHPMEFKANVAKMKNPPQLWHPILGTLMTNDSTDVRTEEAKPCFALSKNDFYLISTFGGQVSLFNIATFEVLYDFQVTMATFMRPPPVPMYVAFYLHNNNILPLAWMIRHL
ncbi:hypothetical protein HYC85_012495 [Camellia sinensis]|uniref:Uncharacterized protein n=1 Tax=Camellia sinensis TaxID=4442 RepID=A0A7J7HC37_CAMSI|nr:hypothetical protein HYC85_012495 [Camellia sinensis]